MTAKKTTTTAQPSKPDLHLPAWNTCPDCGHRSTGRIQHGPHPKGKP
jgi:hypothetical protein